MSLTVIKAGILDTFQDLGRSGYRHLGVNPGGAMDKFALQLANLLVGNNPHEAALELHFPASVFLFNQPALIALSGGDLSPSINGESIPNLHAVRVSKNDVLQFHKPASGARAYLSVRGGFNIDCWMNSHSTHLKAGAGGFGGRALHKNDELSIRQTLKTGPASQQKSFSILPWKADPSWGDPSKEILVLEGKDWGRVSMEAQENFQMTSFLITQQSDRMGYRLNNIPFPVISKEELVSSAVNFGTLQLLPDGKLILLMADHQTTGGYPRIAHVITAHHSKLAQLKAGDKIHFQFTDQYTAEELLIKQEHYLQQLQSACALRLEEYFYATGYQL